MHDKSDGHQLQLLSHYGYSLDPDLVVVAMNPLHDIELNNREFSFGDGVMRANATTCKPASSRKRMRFVPFVPWLREHSQGFAFLTSSVRKRRRQQDPPKEQSAYERQYDLDKTKQILTLMKHDLDQRGIDFAVVFLSLAPLRSPIRDDADRIVQEIEGRALEELQELLTGLRVAYYSFYESFARGSYPDGLSFERTIHFNANGHSYLASNIERFLVEAGKVGLESRRADERSAALSTFSAPSVRPTEGTGVGGARR